MIFNNSLLWTERKGHPRTLYLRLHPQNKKVTNTIPLKKEVRKIQPSEEVEKEATNIIHYYHYINSGGNNNLASFVSQLLED